MSDSDAESARWTSALDGVVAETAAGRLLPGVCRCLLRVETPRRPAGWSAAASTHRDDHGALDSEVAFRIASVSKMMTATALLALADQGRCRLEDPTGRYLPSDLVDRFRDHTGRPYAAAITLRQLLDHTSGLPNFFSQPSILEAVQHGAGRRRFRQDITDMDPTVDWAGGGLVSTAADLAAFLRALTRGQLVSAGAWREMTRWQPGPEGFYDDYGLGLGRYRFPAGQVIGHHGVWGAFAFWSPELDAFITGTVNTGRVDRRPLLEAVVRALLPPVAARDNRR